MKRRHMAAAYHLPVATARSLVSKASTALINWWDESTRTAFLGEVRLDRGESYPSELFNKQW